MVDLTKRQQEIFDFIKRYSAKYGYPPTVRDIGKAVGLASSSTVHAHLANLEKLGLLRRDPSKPRAIELLDRVPDVRDLPGAAPTPPLHGEVRFDQVSFAYEHDRRVLTGIDLTVRAGQHVTIGQDMTFL